MRAASVGQQRHGVAGSVYMAVSVGYDRLRTWEHESGVSYELRTTNLSGDAARLWNREQKIVHVSLRGAWSIYLDGSLTPRVPLRGLVEEWLGSHEMALFKHPHRDCVYDEIEACLECGKITVPQAEKARAHLIRMGMRRHAGLWACGMLARRVPSTLHGRLAAAWMPLVRAVPRDQLWLPLVLRMWRAEHRVKTIDADIFDNPWFEFRRHGT